MNTTVSKALFPPPTVILGSPLVYGDAYLQQPPEDSYRQVEDVAIMFAGVTSKAELERYLPESAITDLTSFRERRVENLTSVKLDIARRIALARSSGKTPIMVVDIDGTVVDARARADRIIAHAYYNRSDPETRRHLDLLSLFHGIAWFDSWKIRGGRWWDAEQYFSQEPAHIRDHDARADVSREFKETFFGFRGWIAEDLITESAEVVAAASEAGATILFASLRGTDDDVDPSTGESRTVEMLKAFDLWRLKDIFICNKGASSKMPSNRKASEKEKVTLVENAIRHDLPFIKPQVIAVMDNDPFQLRKYFDMYYDRSAYIYIGRDIPPRSSTSDLDTIHTLRQIDPLIRYRRHRG